MKGLNRQSRWVLANTVCILLVGIATTNTVLAETSVWSVTSGNNTVYLGGTVHLLRPSDYPLPDEYEEAYRESSEIVFETDISSMNDLSVQTQMLQQLTYGGEQNLKTVLNDEAYAALSEYAAAAGMPLMMLEKFKPGLLISTFQLLEFQRLGFTPQGVDTYFNSRAVGDAKSLGQLETVQEQIGFLAAMGEGNESEFILLSLSELGETEALMEEMIQAWRAGNNEQLSKIFVEELQAEAPELYDSLLLQRNLKWLPKIDQMLDDNDTEFVLVGAAHLVGENGLLALLAGKGYQIKQL